MNLNNIKILLQDISEFEILENNSLNYINNGMYMVALAILIFVALRAARVTNESGGNIAAKILTSIFGVFVAFFSLQLAGWRVLFDTNTAARLAELQESGVELSIQGKAWLNNSGATSGDYLMEPPMFADIPSVLLTLVILLMILGTTWGPRIKIGAEN